MKVSKLGITFALVYLLIFAVFYLSFMNCSGGFFDLCDLALIIPTFPFVFLVRTLEKIFGFYLYNWWGFATEITIGVFVHTLFFYFIGSFLQKKFNNKKKAATSKRK